VRLYGEYGRKLTIWKIQKKGKSNSEKIWKIQKKSKLNSDKIRKIENKIVKRFGKY
jgi:peptidoglycan hydrolase CwlO-like protein